MSQHTIYQEPLVSRYTSREMQEIFSEKTKFTNWRKCWVALAEAQYELGLTDIISMDMIEEMIELKFHITILIAFLPKNGQLNINMMNMTI